MKMSRFHASVPAAVAVSCAALLAIGQLVACGGDDASVQSTPSDASVTDSTAFDGAFVADGGTQGDADAAVSVAPDADAGGLPDGSAEEAGCTVAVPSESEFFGALAETFCQGLKGCCNTGSDFNTASCLSIYGNPTFGGLLGIGFAVPFEDGGRTTYDPAAACQCVEGLTSLGCGLVPADTLASVQHTCLAAIHGNVPGSTTSDAGDAAIDAGDSGAAGCASSYECASGYCTVEHPTDSPDASLGVCLPLADDGGACATENQCSSLGNGDPSLHCQAAVCVPRSAAGTACTGNTQCISNLCQPGADGGAPICVSGVVFSSAANCAFYHVPDAGAPDAGDGG
jgi:hypothetical protein